MNKAEIKLACRKVMMGHLESKGYPNMTNDQILQELRPMWVKLEEAKLIQPGMSFAKFAQIATQKALEAELFGNMRRGFQP